MKRNACTMPSAFLFMGLALSPISVLSFNTETSWASSDSQNRSAHTTSQSPPQPTKPWHAKIESQWGGHVKIQGSVSWPDDESYFQPVGTGSYCDGHAEFRLKNKLFFAKQGYLETHYEAIIFGGDTRKKEQALSRLFPDLFGRLTLTAPMEDDQRLFDLTKTVDESDGYILYHRLDRLSLTLQPKWGTVCIGRQALTWGNGLLFNPMDLFNPFSPTDIERDYKVGDDMVTAQFPLSKTGDFQFLYVPRRDPATHNVAWDRSSLAAKIHFASGVTGYDIMGAKHYEDFVVGLGSTGYLWDTAWRLDSTWTFLQEDKGRDSFLSLVANMDYSWIWWGKNLYGFLEFYFNGLGDDHYTNAYADPDISERLARGEIFALGSTYLSGHIKAELHPLLNVYLTVINNLADPSGTLQPRAIWGIAEDAELTFGGNIYFGAKGSEYGGFEIPGTNFFNTSPDSIFVWLTYFF